MTESSQCTSCRQNMTGYCKHYHRKVPACGPYPNWEYCLQHAYPEILVDMKR